MITGRPVTGQLVTGQGGVQDKGRVFVESFVNKLSSLLKGTTAAPAGRFGETLQDEHMRAGAFVTPDGKSYAATDELPNANMRLYGGAQYNRAMQEFRCVLCPLCDAQTTGRSRLCITV